MLPATKQAMSINLATYVRPGFFLLGLDFANGYTACPACCLCSLVILPSFVAPSVFSFFRFWPILLSTFKKCLCYTVYDQQTMGSNCVRTIDVTKYEHNFFLLFVDSTEAL